MRSFCILADRSGRKIMSLTSWQVTVSIIFLVSSVSSYRKGCCNNVLHTCNSRAVCAIFTKNGNNQADENNDPVVVRPPPLVEDYIQPMCWNFTYGNWLKMEFFSPNYPNKYFNNTDCVQYLEAPYGYKIHLDFRAKFSIESSDECKYDFLEIRDGPFAYSPIISRFCGQLFPPLIKSTSQYLWIRFKTDDILQYRGFHALYTYVKDEDPKFGKDPKKLVCRVYINSEASDGMISDEDLPPTIISAIKRAGGHHPVDCTWEIRVKQQHKIRLKAMKLGMALPKKCTKNFLEIYEDSTLISNQRGRYCAGPVTQVLSRSNRVYIRVFAKKLANVPKFQFLYTAFRQGPCSSEEFSCKSMCLGKSLKCNKNANCDDWSDEARCNSSTNGLDIPYHAIILGAIGFVFVIVATISICVTVRQKKREKRNHKEALRQQTEQKDNSSPAARNNTDVTDIGGGVVTSYISLPRTNGSMIRDHPHRSSLCSTPQTLSEGDPTEQFADPVYFKRMLPLDQPYEDDSSSPCSSLRSHTKIVLSDRPPPTQLSREGSHYWRHQTYEPSPPSYYKSLTRTSPYKSNTMTPSMIREPISNSPYPAFKATDLDLEKRNF